MLKKISYPILIAILMVAVAYLINNKESDPNFLHQELVDIEQYIAKRDVRNTEVSQADVAWHLDHTLKTVNQIYQSLKTSKPEAYTPSFNIKRAFVHTMGLIPRGAAQSPANVRPPEAIRTDSIHIQLDIARKNVKAISDLADEAYFDHPVFEHLDRDQTRRFIKIHTRHHLKIIKDILEQ